MMISLKSNAMSHFLLNNKQILGVISSTLQSLDILVHMLNWPPISLHRYVKLSYPNFGNLTSYENRVSIYKNGMCYMEALHICLVSKNANTHNFFKVDSHKKHKSKLIIPILQSQDFSIWVVWAHAEVRIWPKISNMTWSMG